MVVDHRSGTTWAELSRRAQTDPDTGSLPPEVAKLRSTSAAILRAVNRTGPWTAERSPFHGRLRMLGSGKVPFDLVLQATR